MWLQAAGICGLHDKRGIRAVWSRDCPALPRSRRENTTGDRLWIKWTFVFVFWLLNFCRYDTVLKTNWRQKLLFECCQFIVSICALIHSSCHTIVYYLPNQLSLIIFVVAVTVFPLLKNNPVTMAVISLPACYFTISTDWTISYRYSVYHCSTVRRVIRDY